MTQSLVARCSPREVVSLAGPARRRISTAAVFAGVAVALLAAAAIQLTGLHGAASVERSNPEFSLVGNQDNQTPDLPPPSATESIPDGTVASLPTIQPAPVPLLPLPVVASRRSADARSRIDWALARAIERHPELVDGPEREGALVVAIALYEDGRILSEAMRFAAVAEVRSVQTELRQGLPPEGSQLHGARQKNSQLPDGRVLRSDVNLFVVVVPDQFDAARSNVRVAELVRASHSDLMVPATSTDIGRLILFMSEDGQIQRESYASDPLKGTGRVLSADDPDSVAFLAQQISTSLGVDIKQIGLIGLTTLQDGPATVGNVDGTMNVSDKLRVLPVLYAWPRRAGERGPAWGQSLTSSGPEFDTTAALAIVERYMPDAFIRTEDRAAGQPVIVLTAEGRFVRATRLLTQGPIEQRAQQQEQLLRNAAYTTSGRLRNQAGLTADVMFVWEKAPAR